MQKKPWHNKTKISHGQLTMLENIPVLPVMNPFENEQQTERDERTQKSGTE
jgi:hypothetical protein